MNSLLSLGLMTLGMKGYKQVIKTQNIEVKYANSYRLRLQSNRWKNNEIHSYVKEKMAECPLVEQVSGSPAVGSLLFLFKKETLTEVEFKKFMDRLAEMTDASYEEVPITALNRVYDEKIKADHLLKRSSMGWIDIDTVVVGLAAYQGIKYLS